MRLKIFLSLLLISGLAIAAVPSWVQPGVVVAYDGVSSGIQNGQPVNGVQTLITLRVTSVSGNTVTGTTEVTNPQIDPSIWHLDYQWTCVDGTTCDWRFWVDPANPTSSVKGPNGEPYTIGGPVTYQSPLGGQPVTGTYVMYYSNADTHVEYHLTYEARTGLIAAYAEKYPTQQTYLYLKSINTNLGSYQPPAQQGTQGLPGTGNNTEGTGNAGSSVCPVAFLMLLPLAFLALVRRC